MCTTDPIADLLTRLRNAVQAKHRYIDVPWSNMKQNIVEILKKQGYVAHSLIKEENKKKTMRVFLKYGEKREPVLNGLKRVSKPSIRRYVTSQKIPQVMKGMGIAILSTSRGVMDGETAKAQKTGGELLCLAW